MLGLLLVLTIPLTACGTDDASTGDQLHIVTTTSIWEDVVSQIVGTDAEVEVLIPAGADPHDYQATPRQVAALTEADLVVANGLGLEEGLHDVLDTAAADGANLFEIAPLLDPIPFQDHDADDHEGSDHDHGSLDPHVWFDPDRVANAATLIAGELEALDPSIDWGERADLYAAELQDVDNELDLILDRVPVDGRKLVTNHDALGYLAARYGFEVVGVVVPGGSTLGDPSSAELSALVATIEEEQVPAIFAETSHSSAIAEAVAAEVGRDVVLVELYTGSLGEPGSGVEHLTDLLPTDAQLIADALSER